MIFGGPLRVRVPFLGLLRVPAQTPPTPLNGTPYGTRWMGATGAAGYMHPAALQSLS